MHLTVNGFRVRNILFCGLVYNYEQFNAHRKQTTENVIHNFAILHMKTVVESFFVVVDFAVGRCN